MNLDVLFIDTVTPYVYDSLTLDTQALGGTEATVIRVAEALGSAGMKVGVVNHRLEREHLGVNVYYLPESYLTVVKATNVIGIRSIKYVPNFKASNKFIWLHDLASANLFDLIEPLIKHDITTIAVSKWHKENLKDVLCRIKERLLHPKITYIYNPVQDNIYVPKDVHVDYDPNKLVWLSSPHKGLTDAIRVFKKLKEVSGNDKFEFHVFNPGYLPTESHNEPGLRVHGSVPASVGWEHAATSLCVFYPTRWKETFGLVGAEANAVKCPVITYEQAGLAEILTPKQLIPVKNEKALIDRTISWYSGDRPNVYGNNNFKLSSVILDWIKLFTRSSNARSKPSGGI